MRADAIVPVEELIGHGTWNAEQIQDRIVLPVGLGMHPMAVGHEVLARVLHHQVSCTKVRSERNGEGHTCLALEGWDRNGNANDSDVLMEDTTDVFLRHRGGATVISHPSNLFLLDCNET